MEEFDTSEREALSHLIKGQRIMGIEFLRRTEKIWPLVEARGTKELGLVKDIKFNNRIKDQYSLLHDFNLLRNEAAGE